jgi:hypothetical protein
MEETDQKPIWTPEQREQITKIRNVLSYADSKVQNAEEEITAIKNRLLMVEKDLLEKIKGPEH